MLKTVILTLLILLGSLQFSGCVAETIRGKKTATIRQAGEDYFIKATGWDMPHLAGLRTGESSISHQPGDDGKLIAINLTNLYPASDVITDEPLASVGYKLGVFKLVSMVKCDINGHVFEYSQQVTSVISDQKSGKIVENGTPYFFRYYDMDGDGLFETLVTDSSDIMVPDWAQKGD